MSFTLVESLSPQLLPLNVLENCFDVLPRLGEAQGNEHFLQVLDSYVALSLRIQLLEEAFDVVYLFLIIVHQVLLAVLHQPVPGVRFRLEDVLGHVDVRRLCHF